ncbi:MAG: FtsX-like permease family protein, partial [Cytophagales bacterium]|nr:FtsX-like permease family protein [Cytophagales bacterium]
YVLLDPKADYKKTEAQLTPVTRAYTSNGATKSKFFLQPLENIHLRSNLSYETEPNGSMSNVYSLALIAVFILIIAWVNYINLSTARSLERAKEVGIRKVMGAERGQLIKQYILESVFLSIIAAVVSVMLFLAVLPFFKQFLGDASLQGFSILGYPSYWVGLLIIFLAGSVLAGLYPAFVLSSFQPIEVLKNKVIERTDRFSFRKALVVFQFAVSYVLITATMIIYYQINYMKEQNLGFTTDRMVVIKSPNTVQDGGGASSSAEVLRGEITKLPMVSSMCISSNIPGKPYNQGSAGIRRVGTDPKEGKFYNIIGVDYDFIPHYQMRLVSGRNFTRNFGADSSGVVLNEAAAAQLGFKNPKEAISKKIHFWGIEATILGVISNYHHESLKSAFTPIIFSLLPQSDYTFYSVKLNGTGNNAVHAIQEKWSKIFPDKPYDYFFLDDFFNEQYRTDDQTGQMFTFFSILAILVASMGLFGFSAYVNRKRTKEVGIRRILGATAISNFLMLCASSVRLVLIAVVIASPLTYYLLHRWLQNFPFAVDQNLGLYTAAAALLMFISLLTIAYQAFKTARVNPVKTLKNE